MTPLIPSLITHHLPTVWLVLHTLLAAALVYSCACRFARTSKHRTRAGIRWAFNGLVIYAGSALFAPWACGWEMRLANAPPPEALHRLQGTAEMLERIRARLGVPVIVSSGYRGPALNRAVGGATTSDHMSGQAADIVAPAFGTPYQIAKALAPLISVLGIGQLILEGVKGKRWVHVSTRIPDKPVNRVITITDAGAQLGIQELA